MASRGSVQDSSFSSPRTPKAPVTLPSRIRRSESFFMSETSRAALARGPSGSGRSGLRLGRFLVQVADLVAHLGAIGDPLVDSDDVQHDALLATLGHRVVVTDALDVAAVAGAADVGDDDVVERTLLGAAAGQSNLDHGCFPVLPSRRNDGVSR